MGPGGLGELELAPLSLADIVLKHEILRGLLIEVEDGVDAKPAPLRLAGAGPDDAVRLPRAGAGERARQFVFLLLLHVAGKQVVEPRAVDLFRARAVHSEKRRVRVVDQAVAVGDADGGIDLLDCKGELPQALLRPLALADVPDDTDGPDEVALRGVGAVLAGCRDLAVGGERGDHRRLVMFARAVAAAEADFEAGGAAIGGAPLIEEARSRHGAGFLALEIAQHLPPADPGQIGAVDDGAEMLSDERRGLVPQAPNRLVYEGEVPVGIDAIDDVRKRLHEAAIAILARPDDVTGRFVAILIAQELANERCNEQGVVPALVL